MSDQHQPARPAGPGRPPLPSRSLGTQKPPPLRTGRPYSTALSRFTQNRWASAALLLLCALAAGVYGLWLAIGPYDNAIFQSFFRQPGLLVKNLLPPVLLTFCLWPAVKKARLAFLIGSGVGLGFPAAGYYLLRFRDDPMRPVLLRYLREGFAISATGGYDLFPDGRLWGAILILAGGYFLLRRLAGARPRTALLWLPVAAALLAEPVYRDRNAYQAAGETGLVERFSASQQYLVRGFWYPFLHELLGEGPQDYNQFVARQLDACPDQQLAPEQKLDILILQREAYADFSVLDIPGMDWSCYDLYHQMQAESYTGRLMTNTFAGGTVTTERSVLTGQWDAELVEEETNSYAWYFKSQGYATGGCHPCYEWFYDRKEVNPLLGLDEYLFSEDTFSALSGEAVAYDDIMLPVLWEQYQAADKPYFGFSVTYQGHGPYPGDSLRWENAHYADGALEKPSSTVVNNYLASLRESDKALAELMERLRSSDRPAVLVVYGDHKPWLGDSASIYRELGIDLDRATPEGFANYFATEYLIWANPAAQALLGRPIQGEGPDVSPCYLMNLLLEQLGWEGPGFARLMEEFLPVMPVINVTGQYVLDGRLTDTPGERQTLVDQFLGLQQVWKENFRYGEAE